MLWCIFATVIAVAALAGLAAAFFYVLPGVRAVRRAKILL